MAPSDEGQSGRERARTRRQGRQPRKAGRSASTRLDGGEHTQTLSASTAPTDDNILWSTIGEKPAHSGARQHLYGHTRPETTMIDAPPELAKHRAALERLRCTDGNGPPLVAGRPVLAGTDGWQSDAGAS